MQVCTQINAGSIAADPIYGRRSADSMIAIGDGNEEEAAARITGMEFVRIDDRVESLRGVSSL